MVLINKPLTWLPSEDELICVHIVRHMGSMVFPFLRENRSLLVIGLDNAGKVKISPATVACRLVQQSLYSEMERYQLLAGW